MLARLFVVMQYLLPRHAITALVYRLARIRIRIIKDLLISGFVKLYNVDLDEVDKAVPESFASFNDFFVRELASGARPVDAANESIISPVDGTLSLAGELRGDLLLQAKGLDYSLADLLATDLDEARAFENGRFATIYLAPYNYHRVHAPFDGQLQSAHYVPGDLFSVNDATVRFLPGVFRKNERLNLHFQTSFGTAVLIFVGALNVGSISTPWTGEIRPRKSGVVELMDISAHSPDVRKGDLLGWFNMGSTVIMLLPQGAAEWRDPFAAGTTVRMGESIGRLTGKPG